MRICILVALFVATMLVGSPVYAANSPFLDIAEDGATATQPENWKRFCEDLRNTDHCVGGSEAPARVKWTPELKKALEAVNDEVNDNPRQKPNVVRKRALLLSKGMATEALLIAHVSTGTVMRPVLVVRTDKGDYVLDVLFRKVRLWYDFPYHYMEVQWPKNIGLMVRVIRSGERTSLYLVHGPRIPDSPSLKHWASFCERHPSDCIVPTEAVASGPNLLKTLTKINDLVNKRVKEAYDKDAHGKPDWWEYPSEKNGFRGDCEDITLLKKKLLIEAGVPRGALYMAGGKAKKGVPHAVLVVRTEDGDLVLDNLNKKIVLWHQNGFDFYEMQNPANISEWVRLKRVSPPPKVART